MRVCTGDAVCSRFVGRASLDSGYHVAVPTLAAIRLGRQVWKVGFRVSLEFWIFFFGFSKSELGIF